MTDSTFVEPADNTGTQSQTQQTASDNTPAGGDAAPDTRSPEYQLSVMQQRLSDKDEFINTLKEENQTTREMYATLNERLQNMENISEVLKSKGKEQHVETQATDLDEDAVVGKVIENLNKRQTEAKMKENYDSVLQRLNTEFGSDHIESKVREAAQENGLSVDDMKETARKSPQAFYKLVGLGGKPAMQTPTPTRSTQVAPQDTGVKDYAYYARLMREDPRTYWKPEVQREFRKLFTDKK